MQAPPTTETEVFLVMFDYIDRLFGIVRPRKLLYMAIGELTQPVLNQGYQSIKPLGAPDMQISQSYAGQSNAGSRSSVTKGKG